MSMTGSGTRKSSLLRLEEIAAFIAGMGVLVMMLLGGIDVLMTNAFSYPIPGTYEITETMMVACVFLALALSQREKRQIRVELFTERLKPRARALFDLVAELCSLVVYALIAWFGAKAALSSTLIGEFSSGIVRLPIWPAKIALAVGALLMCMQCGAGVIEQTRKIRARGA